MDFEFFQRLTDEGAREFLGQYLLVESEKFETTRRRCIAERVRCDYTVESVAGVFHWIRPQLTTVKKQPDPNEPAWIRKSDSYVANLFEFDEPSKTLIVRASYYLGASFVNEFECLQWTIGAVDTLVVNMPVVSGFSFRKEMAAMMITENLFRRSISDPTKIGDIETAVRSWRELVPT